MLAYANYIIGSKDFEFITCVADVEKDHITATTSSFDLVMAAHLFSYIRSVDNLFSEVARILAPGGMFVFDAVIHEKNSLRPQKADRHDEGVNTFNHSSKKFNELQKKWKFKTVVEKNFNTDIKGGRLFILEKQA